MKTIKVKWFDPEMTYHEFEMQVPANETRANIDRLVMDEVFDRAVSNYSWKY